MIYDLQKASLTKRFSAFLFDFIMLAMVFTGCMTLISSIINYDGYVDKSEVKILEIQEEHHIAEIEKEYDVSFNDYTYMTKEEKESIPVEARRVFDKCSEAIETNPELIKLSATIMNLTLIIISISLLLSYLILEFAVPLLFKNGQTLGKKIFSIAVMKVDGVKINAPSLFVRTILGKYTIGTMIPIFMILALFFGAAPIMPLAVLLLVLLLQVVMLITTKTNSLIHDALASTVTVDFQSQMIFDSIEAKNEYIQRINSEKNQDDSTQETQSEAEYEDEY